MRSKRTQKQTARDQRRLHNAIKQNSGLKSSDYMELLDIPLYRWQTDIKSLVNSGAVFRIARRYFDIEYMPEQVIVRVESEEDPTIAALRAIESKITELELMKASLELQMTELNEAARLLESLN